MGVRGVRTVLVLLLTVAVGAAMLASGGDEEVLVLGDVSFPHELHYADLEFECESCHHETKATKLDIPHVEYFEDFWINCAICHRETAAAATPVACSGCHHDSPADIADETLSAKVVIHRSCWECHDVGRGPEASRSCGTCHTGHRRPAATGTTAEGGERNG